MEDVVAIKNIGGQIYFLVMVGRVMVRCFFRRFSVELRWNRLGRKRIEDKIGPK